jgi:hypothetical protein
MRSLPIDPCKAQLIGVPDLSVSIADPLCVEKKKRALPVSTRKPSGCVITVSERLVTGPLPEDASMRTR